MTDKVSESNTWLSRDTRPLPEPLSGTNASPAKHLGQESTRCRVGCRWLPFPNRKARKHPNQGYSADFWVIFSQNYCRSFTPKEEYPEPYLRLGGPMGRKRAAETMEKTSILLSPVTKKLLSDTAYAIGKSEAYLIRQIIENHLGEYTNERSHDLVLRIAKGPALSLLNEIAELSGVSPEAVVQSVLLESLGVYLHKIQDQHDSIRKLLSGEKTK